MQSANVLMDAPVVASQPQKINSGSSATDGGLFDSELKQQQQQIAGKKDAKTASMNDSANSPESRDRDNTSNGSTEAVTAHRKRDSGDSESVSKEPDDEESSDSLEAVAATDSDSDAEVPDGDGTVVAYQSNPKKVEGDLAALTDLSETSSNLDNEVNPELLSQTDSVLNGDKSGNILPVTVLANSEKAAPVAEESLEKPVTDGEALPESALESAVNVASENLPESTSDTATNAVSENLPEPTSEEVVNIKGKGDIARNVEVPEELKEGAATTVAPTVDESKQVESAPPADVSDDSTPFVTSAPSSTPLSNGERLNQAAVSGSSAEGVSAASLLAGNRTAGFGGGQSGASPNHQQMNHLGSTLVSGEGEGAGL
ncbi:MAG: hypothetical protein OEL79_08795, partial [Chromatiales bacterium]|nr:hypothetical protein [Chromatiales bacterium]